MACGAMSSIVLSVLISKGYLTEIEHCGSASQRCRNIRYTCPASRRRTFAKGCVKSRYWCGYLDPRQLEAKGASTPTVSFAQGSGHCGMAGERQYRFEGDVSGQSAARELRQGRP